VVRSGVVLAVSLVQVVDGVMWSGRVGG